MGGSPLVNTDKPESKRVFKSDASFILLWFYILDCFLRGRYTHTHTHTHTKEVKIKCYCTLETQFAKTCDQGKMLKYQIQVASYKPLKVKVWKCYSLRHVWLFVTPWTVAHQVPLFMDFSRQGYWSGLPFPSPGDFLHPGIEPRSSALQADSFFTVWATREVP